MDLNKKILKIAKQIFLSKLDEYKLTLINQSIKNKKVIQFSYKSIETNQTKKYSVIPLEIKSRKLSNGYEIVLYAQDINSNKRTKSFVFKNILID